MPSMKIFGDSTTAIPADGSIATGGHYVQRYELKSNLHFFKRTQSSRYLNTQIKKAVDTGILKYHICIISWIL